MDHKLKVLLGTGALAALLTACGGGGSSSGASSDGSDGSSGGAEALSAPDLTTQQQEIINQVNGFTGGTPDGTPENAFCPETVGEAGGTLESYIDPFACIAEANEQDGFTLTFNPVVQAYCPTAADASNFDGSGNFNPDGYTYDVDIEGDLTFPLACVAEAANRQFEQYQDLMFNNPFTRRACPDEAATETFEPEACFNEAAQNFPTSGSKYLIGKFCPDTAANEDLMDPATPTKCFDEASELQGEFEDFFTQRNPLTEKFCPQDGETNFDPATCFVESLENGKATIDDGLSGGDALFYFCPTTAETTTLAGASIETAFECFDEASDYYGEFRNYMTDPNPISDAFCPEVSGTADYSPQACLQENLEGGFDVAKQDITDGMAYFCPSVTELNEGTPFTCFMDAAEDFERYSTFFAEFLGQDDSGFNFSSSSLPTLLCPSLSPDNLDPSACFAEGTGGTDVLDPAQLDLDSFNTCGLDVSADGFVSVEEALGCIVEQVLGGANSDLLGNLDPAVLEDLPGMVDVNDDGLIEAEVLQGVLDELSLMTPEELSALDSSELQSIVDGLVAQIEDLLGLGDLSLL